MTKSDFETLLGNVARIAVVFLGAVALIAVLDIAQVILAPIFLAIVIGLMFGPLSDRIEKAGIPSWISALATVSLFLVLIAAAATGFAVPLSDWLDKLPAIWSKLQSELTDWRGVIASLGGLQEQIRGVMGASTGMRVNVEDTSTVESVAYFAPTFMAQIILFLASMYFFIATRERHPATPRSPTASRRA